jgi:hypothetical protein
MCNTTHGDNIFNIIRLSSISIIFNIVCAHLIVRLSLDFNNIKKKIKGRFTHTMPFPCRSPAMPRICLSESDLSRPRQVRGRVAAGWRHGNSVGTAFWRSASVRRLSATTRSSGKFVIRSMPISDAGGQCETKQRLSWTRRSLLFWRKDMSACIIFSKTIMITI